MPSGPTPRLHKLSRTEKRERPPTDDELRLREFLSKYSKLCRHGKLEEAGTLLASQSGADQETLAKVCEEEREKATDDIMRFGWVIRPRERSALHLEEREKGRMLTRKEVHECLERRLQEHNYLSSEWSALHDEQSKQGRRLTREEVKECLERERKSRRENKKSTTQYDISTTGAIVTCFGGGGGGGCGGGC